MDYYTKEAPLTPIPWLRISEPTGFIGARQSYWNIIHIYLSAENCSGFSHPDVRAKSYDLDCRQKHAIVCQVLYCISKCNVRVYISESITVA